MANSSHNFSRPPSGSRNHRGNPRLSRNGPHPPHPTLPGLAARVDRHDERLSNMYNRLEETNQNLRLTAYERLSQLSDEQELTDASVADLQRRVGDLTNENTLLQHRLEVCEQRSREAEEHAREMDQRLTLAEESARQAGQLATSVDRLVAVIGRLNRRQD